VAVKIVDLGRNANVEKSIRKEASFYALMKLYCFFYLHVTFLVGEVYMLTENECVV